MLGLTFKTHPYFPFTSTLDDRTICYAAVIILLDRIINAAPGENAAWRAQLARYQLANSITFFNVIIWFYREMRSANSALDAERENIIYTSKNDTAMFSKEALMRDNAANNFGLVVKVFTELL